MLLAGFSKNSSASSKQLDDKERYPLAPSPEKKQIDPRAPSIQHTQPLRVHLPDTNIRCRNSNRGYERGQLIGVFRGSSSPETRGPKHFNSQMSRVRSRGKTFSDLQKKTSRHLEETLGQDTSTFLTKIEKGP